MEQHSNRTPTNLRDPAASPAAESCGLAVAPDVDGTSLERSKCSPAISHLASRETIDTSLPPITFCLALTLWPVSRPRAANGFKPTAHFDLILCSSSRDPHQLRSGPKRAA
jgi:hypothetical protein